MIWTHQLTVNQRHLVISNHMTSSMMRWLLTWLNMITHLYLIIIPEAIKFLFNPMISLLHCQENNVQTSWEDFMFSSIRQISSLEGADMLLQANMPGFINKHSSECQNSWEAHDIYAIPICVPVCKWYINCNDPLEGNTHNIIISPKTIT